MKMPTLPHKITKQEIPVTIGRVEKDGHAFFQILFREQDKRKQVWRAPFEEAKQAAENAIDSIRTGTLRP